MSRLLVCPPDFFSIDYEINPWMRRANVVDAKVAVEQWHRLMEVLEHDVGAMLERAIGNHLRRRIGLQHEAPRRDVEDVHPRGLWSSGRCLRWRV